MTPVQRVAPPFAQVAAHFRRRILAGELAEGERLPGNRELATEWGVSVATVSKALGLLQVEGFITTSPQGTYVSGRGVTTAPRDVARRMRRLRPGDQDLVTAAEVVLAPPYVAELLGIEIGSQVIRREWITTEEGAGGRRPARLSVSWFPSEFTAIPELADTAPIPEGAAERIAAATGRQVTHGRDYFRGRPADGREASHLAIPVGAAILAGTYLWSDVQGVIEYGEYVLPPNRTLSYEYLAEDSPEANT